MTPQSTVTEKQQFLCVTVFSTMEETERDEDSENIYMNTDEIEKNDNESDIYDSIYLNTAAQKSGSEAAPEVRQVCSGNPAAVCLGLLCVLLLAVIMALSIKHSAERDQLWRSYTNMTMERDQLWSSYTNMNMERDQLQSSYTNMTMERDQLQSSYTNMTMERDKLLDANSHLTLERNKLQSSYNILTMENDALLKQRPKKACPDGWTEFMSRCYYISFLTKTWDQSRQDCREKGADLVIINSQEEQKFVSGFGKPLWIGLTDREQEGFWKWVDGTPIISGYWKPGEPNNANQDEDCAQATPHIMPSDALSSWNDLPCNQQLAWICEKMALCTAK